MKPFTRFNSGIAASFFNTTRGYVCTEKQTPLPSFSTSFFPPELTGRLLREADGYSVVRLEGLSYEQSELLKSRFSCTPSVDSQANVLILLHKGTQKELFEALSNTLNQRSPSP